MIEGGGGGGGGGQVFTFLEYILGYFSKVWS